MATPDRRRELSRRLSARVASRAVQRAVGELLPGQQRRLAGLRRRVQLTERLHSAEFPGAVAWASNPITFRVGPTGRLVTPAVLQVARHEVSHHLLTNTNVANHPVIAAAGHSRSALAGRRVESVARMTSSQRVGLQLRQLRFGAAASSVHLGYTTPHLRKVLQHGSPEAKRTTKERIRRLTLRVRARGVDF